MLDFELGLHAEVGAFLDGEGLVLEGFDGTGGPEVNGDVGASLDLQSEREDDAFAWVVGVREVFAGAETERLFPLAKGLVVLVCRREAWLAAVGVGVRWGEVGWRGESGPSCWYSSSVFFSPTLKPAVVSAWRSSSCSAGMADWLVNWTGGLVGEEVGKEGFGGIGSRYLDLGAEELVGLGGSEAVGVWQ